MILLKKKIVNKQKQQHAVSHKERYIAMKLTPESVKKKRKELGWSQFDLAKNAKVSRYNISIFEIGHHDLTAEEELQISTALKQGKKKDA